MAIVTMKVTLATSRAMLGNSTASTHKAKTPRTCGTKIYVDLLQGSNMSAAREKDQADFDLERFVDMFDEALISQDPRVMNALRSLMMMVTLTRPESRDSSLHDRNHGPLRRLYEDVNHLNSRLHRMEDEVQQIRNQERRDREVYKKAYSYDYPYEKYDYTMQQAAQQIANKVDQDVLNQLKSSYRTKIQGFK
jgi:hypothetical protein